MRVWAVCVGLLIATRGIAGQQKPELTAAALAVTLHDQGTVALHQIQFDVGKAVIKPESVKVWIANIRAHLERVEKTARFASDTQRQEALANIRSGLAKYEALLKHD
jgi:uncharacterized membrane protein YfbV (UPF0208 family)